MVALGLAQVGAPAPPVRERCGRALVRVRVRVRVPSRPLQRLPMFPSGGARPAAAARALAALALAARALAALALAARALAARALAGLVPR